VAGNKEKGDDGHKPIPTSRVGRFARVARMASGVAGGMLAEGTRQLRAGKRPKARDMLMTPANARRVADQLATMRGAAMKVGQILSMDTGEFLPRELADILARLRSEARYMPPQQLQKVMTEAYGEGWESLFYGFENKPLAAASIGQVHKTLSPDGRKNWISSRCWMTPSASSRTRRIITRRLISCRPSATCCAMMSAFGCRRCCRT
jgi:predicted unusual protein kinase regulating ubiquinone biosynthesis (AarF/ABC1/UbiB family)